MAAVSLSWNTDMTAVTSCEKALQEKGIKPVQSVQDPRKTQI